MRAMKMKRKTLAIVLSGTLALAAAGGAYAYWTNSGTGTGTAGTGTSVALEIAQVGAPAGLAPAAAAQPLNFTVHNPGTGAIQLTGVTITFAATVGCTAADFTITQPAITAQIIAAGATTTFESAGAAPTNAAIQMIDTGNNQDSCKSKTVALTYTSS